MKHIKTAAIIIAYLVIYYALQIVDFIVLDIQAIFKGLNQTQAVDYMNKNMAFVLIPAMIISFIIYFFILRARGKNLLKICKPKKVKVKNIMLIILIVVGYSLTLSAVSLYVVKYFPSYNDTAKTISSTMSSWIGITAVVILAPIFEEIMFRGIILTEISDNIKIVPAVIIQAIIFGIYHMNIFQGLYASILGLVLGYVCVKTKTIVGSITGHITFNICGTFVFPILLSYTSRYGIGYIILGIIILCGATFYFNKTVEVSN